MTEDEKFVEECYNSDLDFVAVNKLIAIIERQKLALEKCIEQRNDCLASPDCGIDTEEMDKELQKILGGE